ncbi:hypothetical protein TNCV_2697721 [Trichonephila clavipes]|nr:hypothetical protein TNCV_2697721 [Trichonephila clavipes]
MEWRGEKRHQVLYTLIRHPVLPPKIYINMSFRNPNREATGTEASIHSKTFFFLFCCPFLDFWHRTATAGSDVVQSGRPIFDDFFQHLWPYIGNNTANVVFQMVKRLWLIRIDQ